MGSLNDHTSESEGRPVKVPTPIRRSLQSVRSSLVLPGTAGAAALALIGEEDDEETPVEFDDQAIVAIEAEASAIGMISLEAGERVTAVETQQLRFRRKNRRPFGRRFSFIHRRRLPIFSLRFPITRQFPIGKRINNPNKPLTLKYIF
jgi:hypothetical protein